MAPNRRQAITWTSDDPVHWRIYAARGGGGDELNNKVYADWDDKTYDSIVIYTRQK